MSRETSKLHCASRSGQQYGSEQATDSRLLFTRACHQRRIRLGDAGLDRHDTAGEAIKVGGAPSAIAITAEREDGLRRQPGSRHGDTDHHRHEHGRQADQDQEHPEVYRLRTHGLPVFVNHRVST